jgi:hypothetical protein
MPTCYRNLYPGFSRAATDKPVCGNKKAPDRIRGFFYKQFDDLGAKKQGCKNTAPKNFNHIFIEKPVTNFHNLEVSPISKLANAIFFPVNV